MTTAVATRDGQAVAHGFNREQIELIKGTIAKGASDAELALFLAQCSRTGLDPFSRQIYWIARGGKGSTQVSIDGFRVIAERTREMDGQDVAWCDTDGVWTDVWLKKEPPAAARVLVYRKGCSHPFPGIAKWSEYNAGGPMWQKMPANQLAKCAEALALRKAFPHQLSGLYTPDEMAQAGEPLVVEAPKVQRPEPPVGCVYLDAVKPQKWGAEVTLSTGEVVYGKGQQFTALLEAIVQEGVAVVIETKPTTKGKTELVSARRYRDVAPDDNNAIDAEIAAKEAVL